MRNGKRWLALAAFALCCAAFSVYYLTTRDLGDKTAPVIILPEGQLEVSVTADRRELLAGVTAEDDEDGDVTADMVVESVSDIYEGNRATVTYAAFDRSGNVAKARRELIFTDYRSPRFVLYGPMIFREGSNFDVFREIGAEDDVDGSLDSQIKGVLVSGQSSLDKSGQYEVEFRVTNSLGDTVRLTLPVVITDGDVISQAPELEEYLVYLPRGDQFSARDYLTEDSRRKDPQVDSQVKMSTPGVYTVTYSYPMGNGRTQLVVVVEE